jgi:phospholipid/cholesterol/gamma-HCH transport system permease protein
VLGKKLLQEISEFPRNSLEIDLSALQHLDSSGVAFIHHMQEQLKTRKVSSQIINVKSDIEQILNNFAVPPRERIQKKEKPNLIIQLGEQVYHIFTQAFRKYFYLMVDLSYWTITDLFNSKAHRKGEFVNQAILIGVNAVPIIALISFLIGLVLALQSAAQLRQFGANLFIADLIVIAMTREMGALLTAIMIAGRSGSAIASEVATMTVTEEIDALKTMALNPLRYVVVPKMHASILTLPLLTILADIMGIFGGMVVAYFYLDLSVMVFYHRMVEVLYLKDIITGIVKSLVFAGIIVQTASYYGFQVRGGAEGVGRYTTSAVVASIFLVILADSILGLIFY